MADHPQPTDPKTPAPIKQVTASVSHATENIKSNSKLKWILIGSVIVIALILLGFLATLLPKPTLNTTPVSGQVLDQNGQPIDGAIVASQVEAVATLPSGAFTIDAVANSELSVYAHGYSSQTMTAGTPTISLAAAAPGDVYVTVLGPNNRPLPNATVTRLDANTSIPVQTLTTDNQGNAIFYDIPSGNTVFVVTHNDYNPGWVETALEAGSQVRATVRLESGTRTVSQTPSIIPMAHAQELAPDEYYDFELGDGILFQVTRSNQKPACPPKNCVSANNVYSATYMYWAFGNRDIDSSHSHATDPSPPPPPHVITHRQFTQPDGTILFNSNFIDETSDQPVSLWGGVRQEQLTLTYDPVRDALEQATGVATEPQTLIEGPTSFLGEFNTEAAPANTESHNDTPGDTESGPYGFNPGDFALEPYPMYDYSEGTVKIEPTNMAWSFLPGEDEQPPTAAVHVPADGGTFIERGSHIEFGDGILFSVINWGEAPDTGTDGSTFTLTPGNETAICCHQESGPNQINSSNTAQAGATVTNNTTGETSTLEPTSPYTPNLDNAEELLINNPNLSYTGDDGNTVNLIDIAAPHPHHAPADFLTNFLNNPHLYNEPDPANMYHNRSAAYNKAWHNYLAFSLEQYAGMETPAETADYIKGVINENKNWNLPTEPAATSTQSGPSSNMNYDGVPSGTTFMGDGQFYAYPQSYCPYVFLTPSTGYAGFGPGEQLCFNSPEAFYDEMNIPESERVPIAPYEEEETYPTFDGLPESQSPSEIYIDQQLVDYINWLGTVGGDSAAAKQNYIDAQRQMYQEGGVPGYASEEDFISAFSQALGQATSPDQGSSGSESSGGSGSSGFSNSDESSELKAREDEIGTHVFDGPGNPDKPYTPGTYSTESR